MRGETPSVRSHVNYCLGQWYHQHIVPYPPSPTPRGHVVHYFPEKPCPPRMIPFPAVPSKQGLQKIPYLLLPMPRACTRYITWGWPRLMPHLPAPAPRGHTVRQVLGRPGFVCIVTSCRRQRQRDSSYRRQRHQVIRHAISWDNHVHRSLHPSRWR